VRTLVQNMEKSSEKLTPENAAQLSAMLFSLRDSLVNLSLALKDAQLGTSDEDQQQTQTMVSNLLGKLKSKID
jgi:Holliday junction resolvasome RuvABC endonuclease subunit